MSIPTAQEFVKVFAKDKQVKNVKFAMVDSGYITGNPRLVFDGESSASTKEYPHLTSYSPKANHRVMVLNGMVIGAKGDSVDTPTREEFNTALNTKANKLQEPWITATLQNGWTGVLQYAKNDLGFVTLHFSIVVGTTAINTLVTSLPVGYRSKANGAPIPTLNNDIGSTGLGLYVSATLGGVVVSGSTNFTSGQRVIGQITYYAG